MSLWTKGSSNGRAAQCGPAGRGTFLESRSTPWPVTLDDAAGRGVHLHEALDQKGASTATIK